MLLKAFIDSVEEADMVGVAVYYQDNQRVSYQWVPEIRVNQYSVSKSILSLATGLAIEEGLFDLTDNVYELLGVDKNQSHAKALTIKALLTMTVGQGESFLMGESRHLLGEKDWVKLSLEQPLTAKPGTEFLYSNVGPYLVAKVIQQKTEMSLVDYLMPRLFEPLGIMRPTWEVDPVGDVFGAGGLMLTTSELLKIGELMLNEGSYEGQQLVPIEWLKAIKDTKINTGINQPNSEFYSYLFWHGPHHSYRADGNYGQYCLVLPEKHAVVAINCFNPQGVDVLGNFWQYLYPKL